MKPLLLLLLWVSPALLGAGPARFSSGPARVSLIELFTSEGCSSCPPAERWLGELRRDPGLWRTFVPVAFHVNYWDRLGWVDRLASPAFTARQYAHAAAWGSRSVYTPCFVLDGAEWRPREPGAPPASGERAGMLALELEPDGAWRAKFSPDPHGPAGNRFDIHVALLGDGIESKVTAGENRGETLNHGFVVLALADGALEPKEGDWQARVRFPRVQPGGAAARALAAWVSLRGERKPLQAAGGWLGAGLP